MLLSTFTPSNATDVHIPLNIVVTVISATVHLLAASIAAILNYTDIYLYIVVTLIRKETVYPLAISAVTTRFSLMI